MEMRERRKRSIKPSKRRISVSICLDKEVVDIVTRLAEEKGLSLSGAMQYLVDVSLDVLKLRSQACQKTEEPSSENPCSECKNHVRLEELSPTRAKALKVQSTLWNEFENVYAHMRALIERVSRVEHLLREKRK